MKSKKLLAAASVAALSAMTLAACSAPEGQKDAASGGSKGSGTLNIACSQQEDFCQKMTAAFEKATGIKSNYVRLGAGEVIARLQATQGEFDVWSGGQAENHLVANDKGFIEKYVSPNAKDLPASQNDKTGIWSGFYTDSLAFCYNEKEMKSLGLEAPHSWQDLLNPKLKGKIVMPHPATAGIGYMVLYTQQVLAGGNQDKAVEYLKKLNNNILQYSKSSATSTEMAGRGEIAMGIAFDSDCAKAIEGGFSDLKYSYPTEGTGFEVGAVSVLKGAKNKEAAKKYMDWILTTKAQDLYASVPSFAAPTNPKAKLGKNVPPQKTIKHVEWDVRKAADSRDSFIQRFNKEIASESEAK